jgi:hypothetical protein
LSFITFAARYHVVLLVGYALYILVVGWRVTQQKEEPAGSLPIAFAITSLIFLALLRLPSIFVNAALNPDEAQYLAASMSFRNNMNSWASSDLSTSGPLNAYPLMWPFLFGLDNGLAVAHLTGAALLGATWLFTLSALQTAPKNVRVSLGGALILFLGGAQYGELIEYASELLPNFLLVGATAITLSSIGRDLPLARVCFAGFCLGATPFAKLQSIGIALTIGFILLGLTLRDRDRPLRASLLLLASACLPAALLLTPLAIGGAFSDFWTSYIASNSTYVGGGWRKVVSTDALPPQVHALATILRPRLTSGYLTMLAGICGIAVVGTFFRPGAASSANNWRATLAQPDGLRCVVAMLVLVASVLVVALPARPFWHYVFFIIWPATIFTGLLWSAARAGTRFGARLSGIPGGLLVLGTAGIAAFEHPIFPSSFPQRIDPQSTFHASDELLPNVGKPRGRLFVWGWMAEFYDWSGRTPATRDTNVYRQIAPSPLREYFRNRLMSDLRQNPPEYIIDAVAKGSFGYDDPNKDSIASFPELASFVSDNYVLLSRSAVGDACPRVYASRAAMAEIAKRYVTPVRVFASASSETAINVIDGVVFGTCPDAWLPPPGQLADIALDLGHAQAISSIEILNTTGGLHGNRATTTAKVTAYDGEALVMEQVVAIPPPPRWADVAVPDSAGAIDRIVVAVKSFSGVGGGLNEIRVHRR